MELARERRRENGEGVGLYTVVVNFGVLKYFLSLKNCNTFGNVYIFSINVLVGYSERLLQGNQNYKSLINLVRLTFMFWQGTLLYFCLVLYYT